LTYLLTGKNLLPVESVNNKACFWGAIVGNDKVLNKINRIPGVRRTVSVRRKFFLEELDQMW